eukprot:CAMPEP_0202849264 /NCGR_PEP_ID=MMETSP1389-20130828/80209_1 /ASSEMBLY_ACC=CAM_ASM_000865 /TAXON_ID=302021 /ORGANISM="Rhodomonas sp., Strain CCMP768" /LENGTH=64 /DNA_ID=CAMNT_0049527249 /DNA_START=18 /DNA_END=209 /DNA_ORIENTATION=+
MGLGRMHPHYGLVLWPHGEERSVVVAPSAAVAERELGGDARAAAAEPPQLERIRLDAAAQFRAG